MKHAPTTPLPAITRIEYAALTTWKDYRVMHVEAYRTLERYLHREYRNRPTLDRATRAYLQPHAALFLHANNMFARFAYAKIMGDHLERHAASLPADAQTFFVTLINRHHVTRVKTAAAFDTAKVVGWTHQLLRGASYVGMVEGAYYPNLRVLDPYLHRAVSWHTHLLVWGVSEERLSAVCEAINERYVPIIPDYDAAHYRPLVVEEVFGQAIYMCKGQIDEYRVWAEVREFVDTTTGEVVRSPTGKYKQKKREIRRAAAVHACRVFAGRTIDGLAFAAGEGRAVLRAVNHEALADFRRWEAEQPYSRARA